MYHLSKNAPVPSPVGLKKSSVWKDLQDFAPLNVPAWKRGAKLYFTVGDVLRVQIWSPKNESISYHYQVLVGFWHQFCKMSRSWYFVHTEYFFIVKLGKLEFCQCLCYFGNIYVTLFWLAMINSSKISQVQLHQCTPLVVAALYRKGKFCRNWVNFTVFSGLYE